MTRIGKILFYIIFHIFIAQNTTVKALRWPKGPKELDPKLLQQLI